MPLWQGVGNVRAFMQCQQYQETDRPMLRDQDILLLKRGSKGRREVERQKG